MKLKRSAMILPKGSADKEQSIIVSGSYTMDKVSLRGEVLSVQQDYVGGGMDDETMLIGVSGDESEKAATFNANESCAVFKKIPVVSKMDSKYQGSMDESVNKTVNAVSGILKSMTGKNYGTTATEKDYKTSIEFKCQ